MKKGEQWRIDFVKGHSDIYLKGQQLVTRANIADQKVTD